MEPRIAQESFARVKSIEIELKTDRQRRESGWKEIAPHTNPDMGSWSDEPASKSGKNQNTTASIYDTTARKDSLMLATGMQTYGYPKGNPWFDLALEEHDNLTDAESKWLEYVKEKMTADLQKSNFYDEGIVFGKCCADFSTSVGLCVDDVERKTPLLKTQHLKWTVIAENQFGEVTVLMREFWLNAYGAEKYFKGHKLPSQVQNARNTGKLTLFKFHQAIIPVDEYDLDIAKPKNRKYYALFWADCDARSPIMDGYFQIKPFVAWRWSRSLDLDPYGVDSPGSLELPTFKQLNSETADYARMIQQMARPTLLATESMRGRITTNPSGVMYLGRGDDVRKFQTIERVDGISELRNGHRKEIDESYYIDFLLILSRNADRPKTATEVAGIQSERALLTSFYGRMDAEFLEPFLEYTFSLGLLSGRIRPPPESLLSKSLRIDMVSPLAQMQKRALKIGFSQQFIAELAVLSEKFPDSNLADNVSLDEYIRNLADAFNINKRIVRDMFDMQRMRQGRAQLQQQALNQQMQMEQAQAGANILSKVPGLAEGAR